MSEMYTEILFNIYTGHLRRNQVAEHERFDYHANFTEYDDHIGWRPIGVFPLDTAEEKLLEAIENARTTLMRPAEDAPAVDDNKIYYLYSAKEDRYYTVNDSGRREDAIPVRGTAKAKLDKQKSMFAPDADWVEA